MKGLGVNAIKQFCSREYSKKGRRFRLSTKPECKKKLGYSPDEADAIAGLCDVVRRNGISPEGRVARAADTSWQAVVRDHAKAVALDEPELPRGVAERGGFEESDAVGIDWRE